jgi:hypothetical protein
MRGVPMLSTLVHYLMCIGAVVFFAGIAVLGWICWKFDIFALPGDDE